MWGVGRLADACIVIHVLIMLVYIQIRWNVWPCQIQAIVDVETIQLRNC